MDNTTPYGGRYYTDRNDTNINGLSDREMKLQKEPTSAQHQMGGEEDIGPPTIGREGETDQEEQRGEVYIKYQKKMMRITTIIT